MKSETAKYHRELLERFSFFYQYGVLYCEAIIYIIIIIYYLYYIGLRGPYFLPPGV